MTEPKKPKSEHPAIDSASLSEETLQSLVTSSRDAIYVIDRRLTVRFTNFRAAAIANSTPEQLAGKNIADLVGVEQMDIVAADVNDTVARGEPHTVQRRLKVGGQRVWLDTWLLPLRNAAGEVEAVLGVSRDVTELKKAEQELRVAAERYRSLVQTSPDSITVTDLDGKVVEANAQGARMYGAEGPEEMVGMSALEFILPEDRALALENMNKTLEQGQASNLQYRLVRVDGTYYWGELSTSIVVDEDGQPKEFIGTVRNITDRKQAEIELQFRNAALARANKQLEQLHKAKDEFIATISHELRTPLVTGMGYVDLLLHGGLGPVSNRAGARMKVALKNLKRLATLIDEILEYHKLADTAIAGNLAYIAFDPVEVCRECVSNFW